MLFVATVVIVRILFCMKFGGNFGISLRVRKMKLIKKIWWARGMLWLSHVRYTIGLLRSATFKRETYIRWYTYTH